MSSISLGRDAPTQGHHVGVVGRRRRKHPQRPSEEVRGLAFGAPGGDARLERSPLQLVDRLLEVGSHDNRGVARRKLLGDGGAAARHGD